MERKKQAEPRKSAKDAAILEEKVSGVRHILTVTRYTLALIAIIIGITLRYTSDRWLKLGGVLVLVGAFMLFIDGIRMSLSSSIPKTKDALYTEARAQRVSITIFFLYVTLVVGAYYFNPAEFDIYFVMGYGAASIPISYMAAYQYFSKKKL